MPRTLFTNVLIFDGSGQSSFPGEVLVQGNRIKTVAKGKDQIDRSLAEEVVDGGGATLDARPYGGAWAPLLHQLRGAQGHRHRAS